MRSGSAHLAGTRNHLAQPAPRLGGGLLGHVCPVGPFSIVPRILAGGCLAPPSGRRRDGKVQSACWASRKSAVCAHRLTEKRGLSPPLPQSASFREIVPPECAFPYGTGCRMRLSVEYAFPHLGKRRAASRKSAFCAHRLTQKCILYVGPHGKVHSACWASRKSALCAHRLTERRSLSPPLPQNASFREIVPPECAFPYSTGCRMRFSVECAFPHLGKRRAASRKSAFCALGLTEKRILHVGPHGKAHSVPATIASKIVVYERREKKTIACPRMSVRPRND